MISNPAPNEEEKTRFAQSHRTKSCFTEFFKELVNDENNNEKEIFKGENENFKPEFIP